MHFLFPSLLTWAWLALVPVALYLFRRKPRRMPVTSLMFFKALAREHQESAWLRRLKRLLSLLLTLAVIAGAAGALARLVVSPRTGGWRSLIILVDRSASMGAKDADGLTRLDRALGAVRARLAGMPGGIATLVVAYDRQPEIVQTRSFDRRDVLRALDRLRVRPTVGKAEEALKLANQLAALETPAAIWHVTDQPAAPASAASAPPAANVRLETIAAALPAPVNVGITALELRRLPLEVARYEAFVQLAGVGPKPLETKLEARIDGTLVSVRELTIQPGGRENLLLPLEDDQQGKRLSLKAIVPGDVLEADNEAEAYIPQRRPIRVVWVSSAPEPFMQLALTSLGAESGIEIYHADPKDWPPKDPVDAAIFQDWLPTQWPTDLPVIAVNPPGACGPIQAVRLAGGGLPLDAVRATQERHPLLYGVASGRVALTQTAALASEGPLEPIWVGSNGPVMLAGETRGQRVAVLGFAPERSEQLPLMASYPLLIGNAIYWAAQPRMDTAGPQVRQAGEVIPLTGQKLTWLPPIAQPTAHGTEEPLRGHLATMDRLGLWRTDAGEMGSSALLSAAETLLPTAPPSAKTESADAAFFGSFLRGDMTTLLITGAAAVLLLESWLFHRHAVH